MLSDFDVDARKRRKVKLNAKIFKGDVDYSGEVEEGADMGRMGR